MKKLILSLACAALVSGAYAQEQNTAPAPMPCENAMHKCAPNFDMPKMGGFKGEKNFGDKKFGHDMKKFHKMSKMDGDKRVGMLMKEFPALNLDDDQWAKVRRIMFEANEAKFAAAKNPRPELLDANGNFDKAKFIEEQTKRLGDNLKAEADTIEALIGVLSAEQKTNLAKNIKERKEQFEARRAQKKEGKK